MIAKLRGVLDSFGEDWCIIDVGGVGYHVFCSSRTLDALNGLGEEVTLLIETHIREDHFHLFGFATELERDWFRLVQTVQGVGAKVALAILSAVGPDKPVCRICRWILPLRRIVRRSADLWMLAPVCSA